VAKYGTRKYGSGVRYGVTSVVSVYYQSNIFATSTDYQTIRVVWDPIVPDPNDPPPSHWALVKSYSGSVDDPDNGTILAGGDYSGINTTFTDIITDVEDVEVSYSLWLFNGSAWKFCGTSYAILVGETTSLAKMSSWLPKAWLNEVNSIGEGLSTYNTNSLVTTLGVFSFMYDYLRVQGSILANSLDPFYTPSALLNAKTTSLGLQYEAALGDIYNRSLAATGNIVNSYKGTSQSLTIYTTALTHWGATYRLGHNMMLDYNDSSFEESVGRWGVSSGTLSSTTYSAAGISAPTPFTDLSNPVRVQGVGRLATASTTTIIMSLPALISPDTISSSFDIKTKGIPVKGNTRYIFSGQARRTAVATTVSARIRWYDQFGNFISMGLVSDPSSPFTATTSFAEFTSESDSGRNGKLSPLNARFADILLTIKPATSTANIVYFDMFQFSEIEHSFLYEDARKIYVDVAGEKENYFFNPEMEYGLSSWTALNGSLSQDTIKTEALIKGTTIGKLISTATGTTGFISDWVAIEPGQEIIASAYMMSSATRTVKVRLEFSNQPSRELQSSILSDEDGQYYPTDVYTIDSDPFTLSTIVPTQVYVIGVTPPFSQDAGNPLVKVSFYSTDNVAGDAYWLDGGLLEKSSIVDPFFSGDGGAVISNPITQKYYAPADCKWETKELYNYVSNSGFETNTTDWTAGSGTLTRITSDGSLGPKFGTYFGKLTYSSTGSLTGTAYLGLEAIGGEDFTVSMYVRKAEATYTLGTNTFKISAAESNDWKRIHTTVQLSAGQTSVPFTLSVANTAGSTSTYFHIDGVQGDYGRVVSQYLNVTLGTTFAIPNPLTSGKTIWASKVQSIGGGKSSYFSNYNTKINRLYGTLGNYMPVGATWGINPGVNSAIYEDLPGAKIPASSFEISLLGWEAVNSTLVRKIAGGTLLADNVTHGQGYCRVTTDDTAVSFGLKTGKIYLNPDSGYYASIAVRPVNSDSFGDYSLVVDYYDINDNVIVVYQDNITGNKTTNAFDAGTSTTPPAANTVITTAARTQTAEISYTDRWAYIGNSFPVSSITGAAYAIVSITFNPTTSITGQAFDVDRVVFRE
jgi:hypothetical protein